MPAGLRDAFLDIQIVPVEFAEVKEAIDFARAETMDDGVGEDGYFHVGVFEVVLGTGRMDGGGCSGIAKFPTHIDAIREDVMGCGDGGGVFGEAVIEMDAESGFDGQRGREVRER